ncbi:MAG: dTDP-4-dehydrorhamnose 3,5-epimerase [Desulfuromonadaceae bacterium]|nr:dTDP-4-dehydrorhamnose 3,5-epimerase [Desulfuromonadaceae bacterium]
MKVVKSIIPDVLIIEPRVFGDDRGFFFESFNQQGWIAATGLTDVFVQDNHSKSSCGVLRGLHYQLPPRSQGKLVRVVAGEVCDVAVDLRKSSSTFGRWVSAILSAENKRQMFIPAGFAHGFLTLSESAEFLYKTTDYYAPEYERSIAWNDPTLQIDWPKVADGPLLAAKDAVAPLFSDAELFA